MGKFEPKDGAFEYSKRRLAQRDFDKALVRVKKLISGTDREQSVAELLDRQTPNLGVPRSPQS